jgi:hypothetical protein
MGAWHKHSPPVLRLKTGVVTKCRDEIREGKLAVISAERRGSAVAPLAPSAQTRVQGIAKATSKIEVIGRATPSLTPREAVGIR